MRRSMEESGGIQLWCCKGWRRGGGGVRAGAERLAFSHTLSPRARASHNWFPIMRLWHEPVRINNLVNSRGLEALRMSPANTKTVRKAEPTGDMHTYPCSLIHVLRREHTSRTPEHKYPMCQLSKDPARAHDCLSLPLLEEYARRAQLHTNVRARLHASIRMGMACAPAPRSLRAYACSHREQG